MSRLGIPSAKLADWPKIDRELWRRAREPVGPFDDEGTASRWRAATVSNCEKAYGVWLSWLGMIGKLDSHVSPCARVSDVGFRKFLEAYAPGRAENTVAGTVQRIALILRAMEPPAGIPWLTRLGTRMTNAASPSRPKLPRMVRVSELEALGERLMEQGSALLARRRTSGAVLYRDGLMIVMLARRPMRRMNIVDLRLGHSLLVDDERVVIAIPKSETKKGQSIEARFPVRWLPNLLYYLDSVRPLLLQRAEAGCVDWLWINRRGGRLAAQDITARVGNLTQRHLGRRVTPHLVRDCAATTVALEDPAHVGIIKAILGHAKLESGQKFYNQATSFTAFAALGDAIDRLRGEDDE